MKTVTIVIPFYNEEKNLEILVPELVENIKTKPKDIDISFIFVNDNSNDNSESVIKRNCDYFDKYYLINCRNFQILSFYYSCDMLMMRL